MQVEDSELIRPLAVCFDDFKSYIYLGILRRHDPDKRGTYTNYQTQEWTKNRPLAIRCQKFHSSVAPGG
ncbi:hypothetical protein WAI453_007703 [Rhynchosporium graminicola]